MRKYIFPFLVLLGALLPFGAAAQTVTGPPQLAALVCAFNTSPPLPVNGQFYFAQCNSTGQLIIAPVSVNLNSLGGSGVYVDPCLVNTPTVTQISVNTATTTSLVTGTAAKQTYVCYEFLIAAGADNVALVEGTGASGACTSVSAGMMGGTTAATGQNLAANQGFILSSGGYWVSKTATAADNVCLITSAATQVSGIIKWVQQ